MSWMASEGFTGSPHFVAVNCITDEPSTKATGLSSLKYGVANSFSNVAVTIVGFSVHVPCKLLPGPNAVFKSSRSCPVAAFAQTHEQKKKAQCALQCGSFRVYALGTRETEPEDLSQLVLRSLEPK